ncbi:MAG: TIGR03936 family radical SAM-associated protein, partial [Propionicimonas sp.]|nr:TIGR03936 family radical SAM-associated protein [Propionicimonas sp.]
MARPQPEQQAPPQQRLRVRYAKRGRARFASHRDVGRAIERALRRADIPMAYSSGFSPHPRISYAGASPTGAASESEYLELGLAVRLDPEQVRRQLNDAMPDGLQVVGIDESPGGSLSEELQASCWRLQVPGVDVDTSRRAVAALLTEPRFEVERMTKTGL